MITREIQYINFEEDRIKIPLHCGEIVEFTAETEDEIWEQFWHWCEAHEEEVKEARIIGGTYHESV